jgi:predicted nucleic acid-binding protein
MSAVVLDTDVWSFPFKGDSRAEHYRPYLEDNVLCISFQTVAELLQWIETAGWGEKRRERLHQWLHRFHVLGYDDATALIWARIRSSREKPGPSPLGTGRLSGCLRIATRLPAVDAQRR